MRLLMVVMKNGGGQFESLILRLPLHLVSSVLKPDLHLLRTELEAAGQLVALGGRQVALLFKTPFQFKNLSPDVSYRNANTTAAVKNTDFCYERKRRETLHCEQNVRYRTRRDPCILE